MKLGPTLEERVRHLEDRVAIGELIARYCLVLDNRDVDAIEPLFTPDARASWLRPCCGAARVKRSSTSSALPTVPIVVRALFRHGLLAWSIFVDRWGRALSIYF